MKPDPSYYERERERLLQEIYAYCQFRIEHFFQKEMIASETMERDRCPLSMAYPQLYNDIQSVIDEYYEDNDIDSEEWDIDAENVFLGY